MAVETLANLEVYDSAAWKFPNGTGKGVSVYDSSSWNIVKEIYVYDAGAWHYVHPIRATSCTISTTSNGSCPSTSGYYRASSFAIGPAPQAIAGTGDYYDWSFYRRQSTVSAAHCITLGWSFQATSTPLTGGLGKTTGNIAHGKPFTGSVTNLWTQFQCRLNHSTKGQMTEAEGGHATSIVKSAKTEECGGPE